MDVHVLEHLNEILSNSLIHTGQMLPFLFVVFVLVEVVSHRTNSSKLAKAFSQPFLGPIAAAGLGLIPQCGFSVVATTLFVEGMIPMGSLLSAYISTSDEALPIMLSDKSSLPWVVPLIATKLLWGAVAGICVNTAMRSKRKTDDNGTDSSNAAPARQPCKCEPSGHDSPIRIAVHAGSRTIRIASMVFVLSVLFNLLGHAAQGRIAATLSKPGFWQPAAAAVIGLIPSCATSVALAESFKAGVLSFPATVSGLVSNSGIGLLILVKEARKRSEIVTVFGLLLVSAILAGFLSMLILPTSFLVHH